MKLGHAQGVEQKYTCSLLLQLCRDQAMQKLAARIPKAANARSVLLYGETGTGKEVCARALHESGDRSNKPLVVVHCGATNEELMSSALFGHKRGAYTGAHEDRTGALMDANGATLYLDEVSRLQPNVQGMMLRAVEGEGFQRLGDNKTLVSDFRLIVATNRDLRRLVTEGKFAEDLYQRLNMLPMRVPPLREREEEVVRLARLFAEQAEKYLSPEAENRLANRRWPGNVRELRNLIERAATFCSGDSISPEDLEFDETFVQDLGGALPFNVEVTETEVADILAIPPEHYAQLLQIMQALVEGAHKVCKDGLLHVLFQRLLLQAILRHTKGNKLEASKILGRGRQTLYNQLKKFGFPLDEGDN